MWPNRKETSNLITFTEKILNGKLNFLWRATFLLSIPLDIGTYYNKLYEDKILVLP